MNPSADSPKCRWKRGRPVAASCGNPRFTHNSPTLQPSKGHSEEVNTLVVQGHEHHRDASTPQHGQPSVRNDEDVSLSSALHSLNLCDSNQEILFKHTASMEGWQSITSAPGSRTMPVRRTSDNISMNAAVTDKCMVQSTHESTHESQLEYSQGSSHSISSSSDSQAQEDEIATTSASDSDYVSSQDQDDLSATENDSQQDEENTEEEAEEHTALTYQIPEELLRAAMSASPNTRASYWSTKLYRGPKNEQLSTHYCQTFEVAERVAKYFVKEKVVGFDVEWRPHSSSKSIKQNASLIQLACEDRVALFHVAQFEGTILEQLVPPTLRSILESPDIYKVGVAVKGDFSRLQKYLDIKPQGVFELSRLHNLVQWYSTDPTKVSNKLVGLANQVLQHLQLPLYKGGQLQDDPTDTDNVRESDWSNLLNMQQIHYAAADAYAGFRLYHMLEWKRKQLRPTPPSPRLCDYDSKPVPRTKVIKKKTTDIPQAMKAIGGADVSAMETEETVGEVEEVGNDDEDGYKTAPEDFMDSHRVDDLLSAAQADPDPAAFSKRVGRINLSLLHGPDPGYPTLSIHSDEPEDVPTFFQGLDRAPKINQGTMEIFHPSNTRLPRAVEEMDDEFADPELEEALKFLEINTEGHLEKANLLTFPSPDQLQHERPAQIPEPASITMDQRSAATTSSTTLATSPTIEPPATLPDATHTSEYDIATAWAQKYLQSTVPSPGSKSYSRIRATVPHLRAYHLWHERNQSLDAIAKHLRDPPLSHSTITNYILQAISLENLEYDKEGLRDVMLEMPTALRKGRWKWMAEKVGATR